MLSIYGMLQRYLVPMIPISASPNYVIPTDLSHHAIPIMRIDNSQISALKSIY